jgi:hypothetical protein
MPNFTRRTIALASLATLATALAPKDRALAQKKYGPGVSDNEIKVEPSHIAVRPRPTARSVRPKPPFSR